MSTLLFRNEKRGEGSWISVSDLMAGLMMVFLLIAVIYAKDADQRAQNVSEIVTNWQDTELAIYSALEKEFRKDLANWNAEIERETLTIRFMSPEILFAAGKAEISDKFKLVLDDFMPRYVQLLVENFDSKIDEVRIEGHTSSEWQNATDKNEAFINNMGLSQARTREVLEYSLNLPQIQQFSSWMTKKVSANGLSSARLVFINGIENRHRSRRVEFNIKTKTKEALFRVLDKVAPPIDRKI